MSKELMNKEFARLEWYDEDCKRRGGMVFMDNVSVEFMLNRIKLYVVRTKLIHQIVIHRQTPKGVRTERYDKHGNLQYSTNRTIGIADKPDTGTCVDIF